MLQYLHQLFEYTAFVLAPLIDARIDVMLTVAVAALLVLLLAALTAMPRRPRIGRASAPIAAQAPRAFARVSPLRGRRSRPTARPRAPTATV